MPEENIELLRRAFDAYNSRDPEAFIAFCDPSIEFHSAFAAVDEPAVYGHEGLREWYRQMEDAFGHEIRVELDALFDLGERTMAFYVLHGRGQQSGVEVAMPLTLVVHWREGRIIFFRAYTRREDALSDLSLSKDLLEPIAP
jgi:ketosteroid isomerase-like protein